MKRKTMFLGIILVIAAAALAYMGLDGTGRKKSRDAYPMEDMTVICPWVQGGGTDLVVRALCKSAEKELGVKLNVVNKGGENGALGFRAIKDAPTDGYTLGMITYELNSLPAEGLLDFTYEDIDCLAMINADAVAMAVRADAPYDTVGEFVDYAKKHPGEITVAQATPGSVWHVGAALFMDMAGLDVKFLPFEGTANAVTAAANGYTEVVAASVAEAKAEVDAGHLKLIGIMDTKHSELFPDVLTFAEQGYDITYYTWRGMALPKGVDEKKKKILEDAFAAAVQDEDFVKEMKAGNLDITYLPQKEFEQFLEKNYQEVGNTLDIIGLRKK